MAGDDAGRGGPAWQAMTALAFDEAADGAEFEADHLCPTLRRWDTVIVDQRGTHRGGYVRRAVEAAVARLLYLPRYSNDLTRSRTRVQRLRSTCGRPRHGRI